MFAKLFVLALVATVHCRYVLIQDDSDPEVIGMVDLEEDALDSLPPQLVNLRLRRQTASAMDNNADSSFNPRRFIQDDSDLDVTEMVDLEEDALDSVSPQLVNLRVRRQTAGAMSTNPDGSFNINTKTMLAGGDKTNLHALAGINGLKQGGKFGAATAGLGLEHANGHGATLTGTNIPGFGNQLTAAGKLGLINNDNHKLSANAFVTRNMPSIPNVPNFNTHGGSVNYLFKDKIGGSLGMAQTDFLKRTDYSAMGNLNLHRTPSSSLDFNAGFSKSVSPFIPNNKWQPSAGLTFSRFF